MASPKPTRAYLPRLADTLLGSQLQAMGVVLIAGMKGCGKTATARQRAASEVLLDSDPNAARRAELDPRLLLDGDTPRLLDEWQRTPRLWDAVRSADVGCARLTPRRSCRSSPRSGMTSPAGRRPSGPTRARPGRNEGLSMRAPTESA
jgi:hypothetical protein